MAFVDAQQAYDFGIDVEKFTRRQNDGSRIVVGRLPFASNNTIPRRMEIREMREDTYKWDLFMLALSMFQYVNQDDPLSWYQIAGTCHR
jgi:tyrosinase